jgi:hypothetical protein
MTHLQSPFPYPASGYGASPSRRRHSSWRVRLLAIWRARGPAPLILRQTAPRIPCEVEASGGRPGLDETGAVIATAALQRCGGLMNAYVASAVDVALEAEALSDGVTARQVRTPIHDLVAEVADALQPCAKAAGATLAYDRDCRWSCVAITDPGRLRKALTHLVLRAMSGSSPGGLVRVLVAAEPAGTRIGVVVVRGAPDPGPFDLASLVRLVKAIGAALVLEPARGGYTPISIVLPTLGSGAPALARSVKPPRALAEGGR